jgi:hypothetical protein
MTESTPYGPAAPGTPYGPATPPPDAPSDPPSPPVAPVRGRNEAAWTAVVLAVLALIGALVPVLDLVTGLLAVVGAVFGILALTRKRRRNSRRLAITGLALNLVALVAWAIAITTIVGLVLDTYPPSTPEAASSPVPTTPATPEIVYPTTLTIELTGSVPQVQGLWLGDLAGEDLELATFTLPLTEERDVHLTRAALSEGRTYGITALLGDEGGTVSCRLRAGDRLLAYDTASGQGASVVCGVLGYQVVDHSGTGE